jgi:hypothetical protein
VPLSIQFASAIPVFSYPNPLQTSINSRLRIGRSSSTFQNSQIKHSGLVGRAEERITPERRQRPNKRRCFSHRSFGSLRSQTLHKHPCIHYTWHIYTPNIHDKYLSSSSTYRYLIRSTSRPGTRAADRVQCISIQS